MCLIQIHSKGSLVAIVTLRAQVRAASRNYYLQGHLLVIKTVGIQMTITSTEDREVIDDYISEQTLDKGKKQFTLRTFGMFELLMTDLYKLPGDSS